jgi:hypothetical protein
MKSHISLQLQAEAYMDIIIKHASPVFPQQSRIIREEWYKLQILIGYVCLPPEELVHIAFYRGMRCQKLHFDLIQSNSMSAK